jgi:hypothetical protein
MIFSTAATSNPRSAVSFAPAPRGERRFGQPNRLLDRPRHLHRITVSAHMDVHDFRRLAEQMVVERCDFDAPALQSLHHRRDFVFREYEIAHHHRIVVANVVKSCPGAECKTWFDFGAGDRDMKVPARHVETDHTSGQVGSWKSEDVFDRLPLPCRRRLLVSPGLCQRDCGQGEEKHDHHSQGARPDR